MDLTVIGGAISGLKTATDIVKGMISTNTSVEVNNKAIELQRVLLSALDDAISMRSTYSEIQDKCRDLEHQIASREEFAADIKRYKLDAPWPGSTVYALDESMSNGEPAHYVCSNCYQSKKKSILQVGKGENGFLCFVCPNCRASVATKHKSSVSAQYAGAPQSS